MGRVAGKVALVLGGGGVGGIGAACAQLLAKEGAKVAVGDIDVPAGEGVVKEITGSGGEATFIAVDVRDEDSVKSCVAKVVEVYGGIDVLHNNVGLGSRGDGAITNADGKVWESILNVNLISAVYSTKWTVPHMIERGGGSIINTISIAALSGPVSPAYAAAKAGLLSLTVNTATWYGRYGIRCNSFAPGMIVTPQFYRGYGDRAKQREDLYLKHNLLPRLGQPSDAAYLTVFLASDESSYITAQMLRLDGGLLAHMPYYADTLTPDG